MGGVSVTDVSANPPGRVPVLLRIAQARGGTAGLVLIGFWLAVFLLSLAWTPHDPFAFNLTQKLVAPSADFWLGTDRYGRDVLSRIMAGCREVMLISAGGTALALVLGLIVGVTAGFYGRLYDEGMMRLMDILMAFPSLLLALLVVGVLGPGYFNVILVVGAVFAPRIARVARGAVLEIRQKEFVEAALARGDSAGNVMLVEILPNIVGPLGVEVGVRFAYAIFLSASLGFLGLGVQPPSPDWGLMVNEGRELVDVAPWISLAPACAIATLVVGVNLLSEACRRIWAGEA